MRNIILGIVIGLAIGIGGAWLVLKHPEGKEEKKPEEKKEESIVQHGTNGEVFLKLNKEAQEHSGIKVAALEAVETKPEIKAYGRVLDPSILATQFVDIGTAQAALAASRKEHERLKALNAQNQNVSARSLEAAEAIVKRDEIALDAARAKLKLTWGETIASSKDLAGFVDSLVSLRAALVRIDVPLGESINVLPSGGRIGPVNAETNLVDAKVLGIATSADLQSQGQGFLFLVEGARFLPGASVIGYVQIPGESRKGVLLPASAIVRYEGEAFVYVQESDEKFVREEVKLDTPLKNGWLVADGLKAGEKVVVSAAQQLLSEELKSHMGEE